MQISRIRPSDKFLRYHLPRCDRLGGALRMPNEAHAVWVPMLEILRAEGCAKPRDRARFRPRQ